jgi:predicted HicB family RNase H-like nuclease
VHEEPPIKFSLYLPETLAQRVAASADQQRLSRNLLVNQILCDWFIKQDEISEKRQK